MFLISSHAVVPMAPVTPTQSGIPVNRNCCTGTVIKGLLNSPYIASIVSGRKAANSGYNTGAIWIIACEIKTIYYSFSSMTCDLNINGWTAIG